MRLSYLILQLLIIGTALPLFAQSELYPRHFDLEQVPLLDSPMKTAMQKNIDVLLAYDADRLLSPYVM